eukprot:CAMPEP_0181318744 /NCGR_PEP_ID=MMETSP1101-20121128/17175_1 /TAXON_ID=46948 /ORGANISM="Rhodomonas abbreviata, Strain Caron Lab Isolate" /LENGTH=77 /DNA_ID=CAMNT_0023426245 /DNA_START=427 /DNA_END=656 /DNA_ORIENTATION=+
MGTNTQRDFFRKHYKKDEKDFQGMEKLRESSSEDIRELMAVIAEEANDIRSLGMGNNQMGDSKVLALTKSLVNLKHL